MSGLQQRCTVSGEIVYVVTGDPHTRGFLKRVLAGHSRRVVALSYAQAAEHAFAPHDLAIACLPDDATRARELLQHLRGAGASNVVAVVSESNRSLGQEALLAGAADYLTLPLSPAELAHRVRLALLDAQAAALPCRPGFAAGDLSIDLRSQAVERGGRAITLTPREQRVLTCLAERAGSIVTHRRLLRECWGPQHMDDLQSLRVCLAQLRRKLEVDPRRPRYLLTVRCIGYRLAEK